MPEPYNLSFTNTTTSFVDVIVGVNDALSTLPAISFLLIVWFIVFSAGIKNNDTKNSMVASSMITLILSLIFWGLELIRDYIVIVPLILFAASVLIKVIGDRSDV